jgi:hypothetical protein
MPSNIGIGNAASQINDGLNLFNTVTKRMGLKDAERFMVSQFLAGDINKMMGIKPTGEWADTPVSGASILGPKIGNGFFMNLNGYFDALTMDRWLMRTFGRLTGTLVNIDKKDIAEKRSSLKSAIKALSPDAKTVLSDMIKFKLTNGLTNDQVDAASKAIAKATMKPKNREVMNSLFGGETFRKAGNNLYKSLDGSKEAPSGPAERNWIRAIFGTALDDLKRQGYDLTMSDLQALLWYPERRLYDAAKSDEVIEGYEDDDAPDYANAAYKLAVKLGADADAVRSAMNAAKGTKRTEPMSEIEKDGLITRMAFELAPDPAKQEQMDAWSAMTDKQREDATKKVRSQIIPSILDLFGVKISTRAMELGTGGFGGYVNPNIQADFGFQTVDVEAAQQIAAAIGYVLVQASVALVDKRLDSPVEVIRLTFDKDPSNHAKQIFEAINKAVPEIDGFSIRGNNFDVLNFTGIPNRDIVDRLTKAVEALDIPLTVRGKFGQLNSKLVERGEYEDHLGRIRSDDSGRVLRQRLDGLREAAATYIGGRAGDRPSRSGGAGRAAAARSGGSPVQQAGEERANYNQRTPLGYYSELSSQIEKASMKQAAAPAWKTFIKALTQKGVKPDEIKWSGVEEWLDAQEGKVAKAQILEYLDANGAKVEEVVLGSQTNRQRLNDKYNQAIDASADAGGSTNPSYIETVATEDRLPEEQALLDAWNAVNENPEDSYLPDAGNPKYGQYTLPGGENYREVLLTLPEKHTYPDTPVLTQDEQKRFAELSQKMRRVGNLPAVEMAEWSALQDQRNKYQQELDAIAAKGKNQNPYRSSHWETPNVLAHIRINDRTDADGKRVMFVEEIQSDHQQDYRRAKKAIKNAVDSDFEGIVARMKAAGVLMVECD